MGIALHRLRIFINHPRTNNISRVADLETLTSLAYGPAYHFITSIRWL